MSKRTAHQNRQIQGYCRQLAGSVKVLVNGEPIFLGLDDLRHYLCASWKKEAKRLALSPEGDAVIILGASTRELTEDEARDLIAYIKWFATYKGIHLIEPREEHEPTNL